MEPRSDIPERIVRNIAKSLDASINMSHQVNRANTVLFGTSIVSAAVTTLVSATTAAQGPIVGMGTSGWQMSCAIAAIFGFVATLAEGFKARTHEKAIRSRLCIERLRLLEISARYSQRPIEEIDREFNEISRTYPETLS